MSWQIKYKKSVKKDLKQIAPRMKAIIRRAIEEKLASDPVMSGIPLRGTLGGYMKLRIGNYRVIYSVHRSTITVHVIKIGHRKEVYRADLAE